MFVTETILGQTLQKATTINEGAAWIASITPQLKNQIVKKWIQDDQLRGKGVDEDNDIIGLYSRATELLSDGRKKEGDPFDLYDSGDFYNSMLVTVYNDYIIISADDAEMKTSFSQTNGYWYRDEILGLNEENLGKFKDEIQKGFTDYLRRTLGLN